MSSTDNKDSYVNLFTVDLGPSVEIAKSKYMDMISRTSSQANETATDWIELHYWPIRGLAERVRFMLEYLRFIYKNIVYQHDKEWTQKVSKDIHHPFACMPCIKDGDTVICQSDAIITYLILKAGREELLGRDNIQKVQIAQLRGVFGDIHSVYTRWIYGQFQMKKDQLMEQVRTGLGKFSKFLGDKIYLCGTLTYMDFMMVSFLHSLQQWEPSLVTEYPNLNDLKHRIESQPTIAKYMASEQFKSRPENAAHAKWNNV